MTYLDWIAIVIGVGVAATGLRLRYAVPLIIVLVSLVHLVL